MKKLKIANKKKIITIISIALGVGILLTPSKKEYIEINSSSQAFLESINEISDESKLKLILEEKKETIKFLSDTFGIDHETVIILLKENKDNLGYLDNLSNFDYILTEYLFSLEDSNKSMFNKLLTTSNKDKDYLLKLISYYTSIYKNVDYTIAASIANVESGYVSKYMLSKNNIFGGMSNGNLIGYKNIEYGILCYIRLLSEGYFAKGLNSVESIGVVYNPIIIDNVKYANPTWVYNVNLCKNKFLDKPEVDASMLNELKFS